MPADYKKLKPLLFNVNGTMITVGLFEETKIRESTRPAPFKLENWHKVYVAQKDPTEYLPAMELLGNWNHWMALREHQLLASHFDSWKQEVEVVLRSEAVRDMIGHSKNPGGSAAAKWLAEGTFSDRSKRSLKQRQIDQDINSKIDSRVAEDLARLLGEPNAKT